MVLKLVPKLYKFTTHDVDGNVFAIQEYVYRTLLDNCKSILNFEKSDVNVIIKEDNSVYIECTVVEQFYDFLVNKNYDRLLIDGLNNNFFGTFEISAYAFFLLECRRENR